MTNSKIFGNEISFYQIHKLLIAEFFNQKINNKKKPLRNNTKQTLYYVDMQIAHIIYVVSFTICFQLKAAFVFLVKIKVLIYSPFLLQTLFKFVLKKKVL